MKPYIDVNAELNKNSTTDFGKDVYKLMNNTASHKTEEHVRKYRDIKHIRKDKRIYDLLSIDVNAELQKKFNNRFWKRRIKTYE